MKRTSNLSRLLGYAGGFRFLSYASWVLSAASALPALVPLWYIWRIVRDILAAAPDYSKASEVVGYGWMAALFAMISFAVYIVSLLCSHLSAFRIASNLRRSLLGHRKGL